MKLIHRYLLKLFLPVFFVSLAFFVLLLQLGDLFAHIIDYMQQEASVKDILMLMWLYIPKCIAYSVPLAILFSGSYTMGNLYAKNELTSIFSAGISLFKFTIPLLFLGFCLSVGMIFFEDRIVIKYFFRKNELSNEILNNSDNLNSSNVAILSKMGAVCYTAEYYNDEEKTLANVAIVIRESGILKMMIEAPRAKWENNQWVMEDPEVYIYGDNNLVSHLVVMPKDIILDEPPKSFQRNIGSVDEMTIENAKLFIAKLKKNGLSYHEELSKYYKRFSFPFTIFIVLFFSISLGGKFKKNILLMSILFSLGIATIFYITQMITMMAAKWEYISPLAGAWTPIFIFAVLSVLLLRRART